MNNQRAKIRTALIAGALLATPGLIFAASTKSKQVGHDHAAAGAHADAHCRRRPPRRRRTPTPTAATERPGRLRHLDRSRGGRQRVRQPAAAFGGGAATSSARRAATTAPAAPRPQHPATPLRSLAAAAACVQGRHGDQILLAEGTSYAEGLPNLDRRFGYSAAYPTVLPVLRPGRAARREPLWPGRGGRRPVVNTAGNGQLITCCSTPSADFLAIRGLRHQPRQPPDMAMSFVGGNDYVLIENNLFRYTQ